jgi:two-component system, OmpR family, response regulator
MAERRVLVVDDEPTIASSVAARLRAEGYQVDVAHDGPSAMARVAEVEPDLVVLDVMLPGFDGLEVCRRIQARRPIPVLMLTARDAETDVLVGLGVGADDYLTKPFSPRELVARVKAVLRRTAGPPDAGRVLRVGAVSLDPQRHEVRAGADPVQLTSTEFDLLAHLMGRPGRVFGRDELLSAVWGYAALAGTRTVDVHVAQVRAKLGAYGAVIRTVRGVGYTADG